MAMRAILLIALAAIVFVGMASADDSPTLPSRKAAVVLPLLKQFSSKDNYGRITQILGKEDYDIGNAFRECFFRLEGSAIIEVKASLDGKRVYFIRHGNDFLYGGTPINSN